MMERIAETAPESLELQSSGPADRAPGEATAKLRRSKTTLGVLLAGVGFVSLSQVGALGSNYVISIVLARILGPVDYGLYGVVISMIGWVETVVTVGFVTAAYKTISEHPAEARHIVWTMGRYLAAIGIGLGVAGTGLARPIAGVLGDTRVALLLYVGCWNVVLSGLYRLTLAVQGALRRFRSYAWIHLLFSTTRVATVILPVWGGLGVLGAIGGNVAASGIGFAIAAYLFHATFNKMHHGPRGNPVGMMDALRIAPAVWIGSLGLNFYRSADLWVVKAQSGGAVAGYYVAGVNIAKVLLIGTVPLGNVLMPTLGAARSEGRIGHARRSIWHTIILFCIVTVPASSIMFVYAPLLMEYVYSSSYAEGGIFLRMLSIAYFFISLNQTFTTILISLDRSWLYCRIYAAAGLICLPAYAWAVGRLGALGTAYILTAISVGVTVVGGVATCRAIKATMKTTR